MLAEQDLIEAEYGLIKILEEKKATFSKGKYIEKKNLIETHHIPEEAIIEMNNEKGIILNIYAPCFTRLSPLPPLLERKPQYGKSIPQEGYTLIDLDNVPLQALYGQIATHTEKKDVMGEHFKAMQNRKEANLAYPIISNANRMREQERLQRAYSPKERLANARGVIVGADLEDILRPKYEERIQNLKDCTSVASDIINGIAGGKFVLRTTDGEPVLSAENIADLSAVYGDISPHGIEFPKTRSLSGALDDIEKCRTILHGYNLQKNEIQAIFDIPLGRLPTAWTEVK